MVFPGLLDYVVIVKKINRQSLDFTDYNRNYAVAMATLYTGFRDKQLDGELLISLVQFAYLLVFMTAPPIKLTRSRRKVSGSY